MAFTFSAARSAASADGRALFVDPIDLAAGSPAGGARADDPDPVLVDRDLWARAGFTGRADQVVVIPPSSSRTPVTYLVGVGASTPDGPTQRADLRVRRAAAALGRAVRPHRTLAIELTGGLGRGAPAARHALLTAVAEGLTLGGHQFTRYKSRPEDPGRTRVVVVGGGGARVRDALAEGVASARAVAFARDLVNTPGGDLTPESFAAAAVGAAADHGFRAEVFDQKKIARLGFHGLLAVNRGSTRPARFVRLTYEPSTATPTGRLALVGKGITFDSGGLSIKTGPGMMTMKDDMGGAAAILGAFTRLREVGVGARVVGYLPLTDNMPGPDAIRPGDVITYANGTSVEVLNTDAEGRLLLADALLAAVRDGCDAVVDVATLTGAVETALGSRVAGLMGNNESLLRQVETAAEASGERLWRLPLPADERSRLDSEVADLRNIGKGAGAGALIAGLFLAEFAGSAAWAHLDIAGTAWTEEARGDTAKGGTGYGVRTLVALASGFGSPSPGDARTA